MARPSPDVVLSNTDLLAKIGASLTTQKNAGTLTRQTYGKTIKNWLGVFYPEIHNAGGTLSDGSPTSTGYAEQQWALKATARLHDYFRAFATWDTPEATKFDDLPEQLTGLSLSEKAAVFAEAFGEEAQKLASSPGAGLLLWIAKNAWWLALVGLGLYLLPLLSPGAKLAAGAIKKAKA